DHGRRRLANDYWVHQGAQFVHHLHESRRGLCGRRRGAPGDARAGGHRCGRLAPGVPADGFLWRGAHLGDHLAAAAREWAAARGALARLDYGVRADRPGSWLPARDSAESSLGCAGWTLAQTPAGRAMNLGLSIFKTSQWWGFGG